MPKYTTNPTIIDDLLSITTTSLRKQGMFKASGRNYSDLNWQSKLTGECVGSIGILVNVDDDQPFMMIDCSVNGKVLNYKINLRKVKSNLGLGYRWKFICKELGNQCDKIYSGKDGYFVGLKAIRKEGGLYRCQLRHKNQSWEIKNFQKARKLRKIVRESFQKGFTKIYNGKYTRKYMRAIKAFEQLEEMGDVPE